MGTVIHENLTDYIKIVKKAWIFSKKYHDGVYRRGRDEYGNKVPYFQHPLAVTRILNKYVSSREKASHIAMALLHDTVEDCEEVTLDLIELEFGKLIRNLVEELTTDSERCEEMRKTKYLSDKMNKISSWGLRGKLGDRVHNTEDIDLKLAGSPSD